MANTKIGRDLLCIDQSLPQIVLFKKNCVHGLVGVKDGIATIQADFRIGAKWANVIRYRWKEFCSLKKYFELERWQEMGKTPYISGDRVYALSIDCYPDPDPETSTVGGDIDKQNDTSWANTRGAADGQNAFPSRNPIYARSAYNGSGAPYSINRCFLLFDTSALTSSASISAVSGSLYGSAKTDAENDANAYISWTGLSNPASNTNLVVADYDQYGTTKYSSDFDITSLSTSAYNDFTFNATGISNISKTSITKLSVQEGHDIDNVAPDVGDSLFGFISEENAGTSSDPRLSITYTIATAVSNLLLLDVG